METLRLPRRRAFSLVELLCVMMVMSLLAATMVLPIRGTMDGYNITGAADMVDNNLLLARQTAITRNIPVEVRFYKYDNGSGDCWRVMAVVIPSSISGNTSDEWITTSCVLPGNVVIEDSADYSTVLSKAVPLTDKKVGPWTSQESVSAPRMLQKKSYVGFCFNPDGSTNLPKDQPWCLTLKDLHAKASADGPATNYVSVVIDSATGRTRPFQP
ncbi:MAG: Verru_Chthon cassette protein D [Chthoniobacteraceae bacterium]